MNAAIALDRTRAIETTTERLVAEFAELLDASAVRAVVESTFARLERGARVYSMLAVLTERAARESLRLSGCVESQGQVARRIATALAPVRPLARV